MQSNQQHNEMFNYAATMVRIKARQLIGKAGFTESDQDDLEQELMSDVVGRLSKFNARRGTPKTFVACIIARKISKLIRHRTTGLRDFRCEAFSIDKPAGNDDDAVPVRGDCVLEDINDPAGASQVPREVEASELAEATQRVISGLPRDLRRLCELLQRGTLADAARELGVPRSTLRYQLPRLRELFESAGLRSYL
jgi:RNA polymerase sigma-70 factor (ECF subfamily)